MYVLHCKPEHTHIDTFLLRIKSIFVIIFIQIASFLFGWLAGWLTSMVHEPFGLNSMLCLAVSVGVGGWAMWVDVWAMVKWKFSA